MNGWRFVGTTISVRLSGGADVEALIYDVLGRKVRVLESALSPTGSTTLIWDGMTDQGRPTASGRYFARSRVVAHEVTRAILRIR